MMKDARRRHRPIGELKRQGRQKKKKREANFDTFFSLFSFVCNDDEKRIPKPNKNVLKKTHIYTHTNRNNSIEREGEKKRL